MNKPKRATNKPDAVNSAIASRFAIVHHWRGVTDPERSSSGAPSTMSARLVDLSV